MLVLLTHACRETIDPRLTITGTAGTLAAVHKQGVTLRDADGEVIERVAFSDDPHARMVRRFAGWVRGVLDDDAVATLERSEAHLVVVNGASDLWVELYGERGRHVRIAMGVAEITKNIPVETQVTLLVRE